MTDTILVAALYLVCMVVLGRWLSKILGPQSTPYVADLQRHRRVYQDATRDQL